MPILYVHGVATRSRDGFFEIERFLRRLLAPEIAEDPGNVLIDDVFWGGDGAAFAWNGESRPRTRLLAQGADENVVSAFDRTVATAGLEQLLAKMPIPAAPAGGSLISGSAGSSAISTSLRLREFSPEQLSDVLALIVDGLTLTPDRKASLKIEADELARDTGLRAELKAALTAEEEIGILTSNLQPMAGGGSGMVGMGGDGLLAEFRDRLSESLRRSASLPAFVLSAVAAELRPSLNDFITEFLGDVFVYINNREVKGAPGVIPSLFLAKFRDAVENRKQRGGEPIIVLSHSMGGQVVYDGVTYFFANDPTLHNERIDFWCATASQVGLFEELKLFRASLSEYHLNHPVPFPHHHLGVWWNVWDHNDFISYTARNIVEKVDDSPFDSGMGLVAAHGGYLKRPSFYRKLAEKLRDAKAQGWQTV